MALRVVRPEPVNLPFGDAYLLRMANEHTRLERLLAETVHQLELRQKAMTNGLASRGVTFVDIGGLRIKRTGRTGVTIC